MPAPPRRDLRPHQTGSAPVFTDPSGRRVQRMRLLGLALCGALLACLGVMAAGLLGGPGTSVFPWLAGHPRVSVGTRAPGGHTGAARPSPGRSAPAAGPAPSPTPFAGGRSSGRAHPSSTPPGSPSSPPATTSPTPVTTNRAGKAPPGQNRTPRPKHTRAH
jgi:hypothetical protein